MTSHPDDPVALAATLGPAERALIVLDHDGTLSPIAPTPDAARLEPGAGAALLSLAARTHVAIVSGRDLADLTARIDGATAGRRLDVVSDHGLRARWEDGTEEALADAGTAAAVVARADAALASLLDGAPGWQVERKAASIAVHHRGATGSDVATRLPRVRDLLEGLASDPPGMELIAGKAVLELRASGADKGTALRRLHARAPGLRPVAVGDDRTDEDMFAAARALGGVGVLVGDHGGVTAASHRLRDPAGVVRFLEALARTRSAA